ncbi:MAG: phosphate ABC transporter substrate-binding/OmpA family protein [Pseudomonadota bacterium]
MADRVKLQSEDRGINVSGDLIEYSNGIYHIRTDLGDLKIRAEQVTCIGDPCPTADVPALGDDIVVIKTNDGRIELEGRILAFEDGIYKFGTSVGIFEVPASEAQCIGAACPEAAKPNRNQIVISTAPELSASLIPALVDGFERYTAPAQDVENLTGLEPVKFSLPADLAVQTSDAPSVFANLLEGSAVLAALSQSVEPENLGQAANAEEEGAEPRIREQVLALDGLAIIVSDDNPVRAILEEDIVRVFSGEITNWSEIGGNDAPINLYSRDRNSGSGSVFFDLLMNPARASMSISATELVSDQAVSEAVQEDPNGIGFASFAAVTETRPLAIRGACGIQTPLNPFTIKTEEYPLTRRLYLYQNADNVPQMARDFLSYTQSAEAQQVIQDAGFVGHDVSSLSINEQGLRFVASVLPSERDVALEDVQGVMLELAAADRISLTYRFEQGTGQLDSRGQADLARLAEMIRAGVFRNKELLLLGFTDSVGQNNLNRELSNTRAAQVRDALIEELGGDLPEDVVVRSVGYGELAPLSCNDTILGRQTNRRVELWTKDIVGAADTF